MAARTFLRRLPGPVGFLLVAVCFLLPFVSVSCGTPELPDVYRVTYTVADLATGHIGTITAGHTLPDGATAGSAMGTGLTRPLPPQPFVIAAMLLVALGVLASLAPDMWWRALATGAAAVLALIFLLGGQVNGLTAAADQARRDATDWFGSDPREPVSISTHVAYGFWFAVALLGALAAVAAVELIIHSRQRPADPAAQIPATVPGPS